MEQKSLRSDDAEDARVDPDNPCYVATDAEFRAAVEAGLADARAGRTASLEEVEAELRHLIHGPG